MIHTDEIQRATGQIQCSMTIVETAQSRLDSHLSTAERSGSGRPGELNLSGSLVLVGWVSALCTVGLFLWAVIKLWLFEP